jgi:hypothetical protein
MTSVHLVGTELLLEYLLLLTSALHKINSSKKRVAKYKLLVFIILYFTILKWTLDQLIEPLFQALHKNGLAKYHLRIA